MPRPSPIVSTLFPGHRVHLVAGASGAGKTTWLMQTIELWRKGLPVHGYDSHPVPFVYLSYDRDVDDFIDTCERLKIDPSTYDFVSPAGKDLDVPLLNVLAQLQKAKPATKLYIIEGLAMQTPYGKINDPCVVGKWLRNLQEFCKSNSVTIIGVLHSPKTKEKDGYKEPRAKIAGCGAWAGYSSTVVILEEQSADTASSLRDLIILPRNARKHFLVLDFKDGQMFEVAKTKSVKDRLLDWLPKAPPQFTADQARAAINAAPTSIYAEISNLEKQNVIRKVSHGIYAFAKSPEAC